MLTFGFIILTPIILLLAVFEISLLFQFGQVEQAGYLIGQMIAWLIIVGISFFSYGSAIWKLSRLACIAWTVIFGALLIWGLPNGIAGIIDHAETNSPVLGTVALLLFYWVFGSACAGLFHLARATENDRLILRTSFGNMLSRSAMRYFSGMPPIIIFVKGCWIRLSILISTFFFGIAFSMLTGIMIPIRDAETVQEQIIYFALALVVSPLSVAAANQILKGAQRKIRFSVEEITAVDRRPPILFLRAFRDDQVALSTPRYTWLGRLFAIAMPLQSLDHLLLSEGTLYGPMVALGNPKDAMPPYGVARGYVGNEHWQDSVKDLARAALAIVICVDDTDSMWWEVEHLVAEQYLDKALILLHPKFAAVPENVRITERLLNKLPIEIEGPSKEASLFGSGDVVGFFFDNSKHLAVGKSTRFSEFTYLLMLRWFLRTKFGLEIRH
jgi:hypothetical protein